VFLYSISRPGADGELSAVAKWIEKMADQKETWAQRTQRTTAAIEQAAHDKHLFYNVEKSKYYELKYPEYVKPPGRRSGHRQYLYQGNPRQAVFLQLPTRRIGFFLSVAVHWRQCADFAIGHSTTDRHSTSLPATWPTWTT